jgi:hypothetical protein
MNISHFYHGATKHSCINSKKNGSFGHIANVWVGMDRIPCSEKDLMVHGNRLTFYTNNNNNNNNNNTNKSKSRLKSCDFFVCGNLLNYL